LNPYINFINLLSAVSRGSEFPKIESVHRVLLGSIAAREVAGSPMTVSDLISMSHIASPATLHKHLSTLVELGYVRNQPQGSSRRTKHLTLTHLGQRYIETLNRAVVQASLAPSGPCASGGTP